MPTKLEKFRQFKTFSNCFTYLFDEYILENQTMELYGKWQAEFFKNTNPIVIEIGCGRGEYTIGLAEKYPQKNFIGIDFKSNRMWAGAKQALEKKLENVAFVRTKVEFLDKVFAASEVNEIWITFPDPNEQKSREKKRLTHPRFLEHYRKFLVPNGLIHLKTDNDKFFQYTLEVLNNKNIQPEMISMDLYKENSGNFDEVKKIKTYYEQLFFEKGHSIKYCQFKLK